jgi:hypothetical protein
MMLPPFLWAAGDATVATINLHHYGVFSTFKLE